MKYICALLLLCAFNNNYAFPVGGSLAGEAINPNYIQRYRVQYAFDGASYVNGGITINYPFAFDEPPRVVVGLELSNAFSPTVTYVPVITANSTTGVTIRVHRIIYDSESEITIVEEALSNEVFINIWATAAS